MRIRTILWPTLLACAAGCGRLGYDPGAGADGGLPGPDSSTPDAALEPDAKPDAGIDPDTLWWDPAWSHRVRLTFNTAELEAQLGEFEEFDIPLPVYVDRSGVDVAKVQASAADVRFVAADNKTVLAHEIERRPSTGSDAVIGTGAVFWVKVPLIKKAYDRNYVWLYYGNPDAIDEQKPADVWSADYAGVWHLGEPQGERKDSTSNAHSLIGDGQFGAKEEGLPLADVVLLSPNDPKPLQHEALVAPGTEVHAFTVEAFVFPESNSTDMMISSSSDGDAARSFELRRLANETIELAISFDCVNMITALHDTDTVDLSRWHHIAGTYNGEKLRIYHNGILKTEQLVEVIPANTLCNGGAAFMLGSLADGGQRFSGRMDELRISSRAQSHAWILAQYLATYDAFITFGAHETRP